MALCMYKEAFMINKKKAIKKCVLPCILSITLLSTVVTPINARVNETFDPVRNLRFTSEVTTGQTASKDKTKLNTDIQYSDDKSSATMTITSLDGYNLSLTDACKESYKSFLDDGVIVLQDENTSKLSVVTNYKNIYRLEINVKNTDNTLVETQNIDFQALDITSVQNESLQEELNIGDANSKTISSVQASHDSKSLGVSYTSNGSYAWMIPSEINLNKQDTLTISATKINEEANASLKISVSSENGFNMKSSTGQSGAYNITSDGKQVTNNQVILETTSAGTSTADLKFSAYPGNFMTAGTYNVTLTFKAQNGYATGTVLEIEGKKYIVLSQTEEDTYELISGENIGNIQFQPNQDSNGNYYDIGKWNENNMPSNRYDGQNSNVYEDSYIDKYLETTYYNSLPKGLKKAIEATQIKQASYTNTGRNSKWRWLSNNTNPVSPDGTSNWFYNEGTAKNPKYVRYDKVTTPDGEGGAYPLKYWTKTEKGYDGQFYNTITRHVYLPSVEEICNLVDLNDANKTYSFLKGTNNSLNHMCLRDASSASPRYAMYLDCSSHSLGDSSVANPWAGVRPAFTIDLSKVNATVVDTVKYK